MLGIARQICDLPCCKCLPQSLSESDRRLRLVTSSSGCAERWARGREVGLKSCKYSLVLYKDSRGVPENLLIWSLEAKRVIM